jgi:hypothetical protein
MAEQVTLDPSDKIVFKAPFTEAQIGELQIKNDGKRSVIFKMKSTRPLRFKMRPVFGLVEPGAVGKVQLTCKPIDAAQRRPSTRDRFTIVTAPAPSGCHNVSNAWKANDTEEVKNHAERHVLAIVYQPESAVPPVAPKLPTSALTDVVEPRPQSPPPAKVVIDVKKQDPEDDSCSSDYSGSDTSCSSCSSDGETDEAHP